MKSLYKVFAVLGLVLGFAACEGDNFRKRTEKEKAAMFEIGAKNIIEKQKKWNVKKGCKKQFSVLRKNMVKMLNQWKMKRWQSMES